MRIFPHLSTERLANVYLVTDDDGNGIIIDPAHIDKEIIENIEKTGTNLKAVLITHRHLTHTEGLGTLIKIYDIDIYSASGESSYPHGRDTIPIGKPLSDLYPLVWTLHIISESGISPS